MFFNENIAISIKISLKHVFESPINIGSDYGLARRQAVIWTNDDIVY